MRLKKKNIRGFMNPQKMLINKRLQISETLSSDFLRNKGSTPNLKNVEFTIHFM